MHREFHFNRRILTFFKAQSNGKQNTKSATSLTAHRTKATTKSHFIRYMRKYSANSNSKTYRWNRLFILNACTQNAWYAIKMFGSHFHIYNPNYIAVLFSIFSFHGIAKYEKSASIKAVAKYLCCCFVLWISRTDDFNDFYFCAVAMKLFLFLLFIIFFSSFFIWFAREDCENAETRTYTSKSNTDERWAVEGRIDINAFVFGDSICENFHFISQLEQRTATQTNQRNQQCEMCVRVCVKCQNVRVSAYTFR